MRLAFLTNMIPPYHKPTLKLLSERYRLRVFLSTPMESNRPWKADWQGLDVVVQRGLHFRRHWTHPGGFRESVTIHVPLDTIWELAKYRPDAIISGEMGARSLLALAYTKLAHRCKLLIWSEVTHATEQGRGRTRALLRRFLASHADGFLALGPGGVAYVKSLGVAADKIFQIEYTTDLDRFTCLDPQRSEEAAKRLLYVGQLVERKGLVPFLRVLAKWAEAHPVQSVEFLVVGSGPLAETIKALPQPRNVKLVVCKAKGYEDLPDIYKAAGIFVLPTLADTWAVVVNEAMASAVPIMGSLCSQAVGQMVEDGKTGWTFQPANEQEIYSAIDRAMMCSPEQLQQMRLAARQRALQITPADVADMIGKGLA